jgi:hypothetical protein
MQLAQLSIIREARIMVSVRFIACSNSPAAKQKWEHSRFYRPPGTRKATACAVQGNSAEGRKYAAAHSSSFLRFAAHMQAGNWKEIDEKLR